MNNQNQQPDAPNTIRTNSIIHYIATIPGVVLIFVSSLFVVFGGLNALNLFSQNKTETTQGNVLNVRTTFEATETNPSPSCEFSYDFKVGDKTYIGDSGSVSSSSNCYLKIGDAVTVHYNPTNPSDNGLNNDGGLIGLAFFIMGLVTMVIGIIIIRRARNTGDDRATSAQIALIQNGLQELGEYWQPRKMTRAEADQVLDDIQTRLNTQKRQSVNS